MTKVRNWIIRESPEIEVMCTIVGVMIMVSSPPSSIFFFLLGNVFFAVGLCTLAHLYRKLRGNLEILSDTLTETNSLNEQLLQANTDMTEIIKKHQELNEETIANITLKEHPREIIVGSDGRKIPSC